MSYIDTILRDSPSWVMPFNEASGDAAEAITRTSVATHGSVTYRQGCPIDGGGVLLNGSDAYFGDNADAAPWNVAPSDFTFEAWAKPTNLANSNDQFWFQKGYTSHTNPYYQYTFGHYQGRLEVYWASSGTLLSFITSPAVLTAGVWQHAAATIEQGQALTWYVNGAEVATPPGVGTHPMTEYGGSTGFGDIPNLTHGSPYLCIDSIAWCALYPSKLSANRLKVHYEEGLRSRVSV